MITACLRRFTTEPSGARGRAAGLTDLSCSWTILRQPTYLENFANDETAAQGTALRLLRPGLVSGLLGPEEALTVISVSDLGALAVALLREGPDAHDQAILAAGSERITGSRLASAAARPRRC